MSRTATRGGICPNFSHRITYTPEKALDYRDLIEGIDLITDRAEAVLNVVQALCAEEDDEGLAEINRINPRIVYYSLDSVIADLKDLAAIGETLRHMASRGALVASNAAE